jgi:hypothetical protein
MDDWEKFAGKRDTLDNGQVAEEENANIIARIVSRASFTPVTDGSCNNGPPSAQIDPLSPKWALSGNPFGTLLGQSFWALRIQLGNPLPEPLLEIGPASVLTRREHSVPTSRTDSLCKKYMYHRARRL